MNRQTIIKICWVLVSLLAVQTIWGAPVTVLKYAYVNAPQSAAGLMASDFAKEVEKLSNGSIKIELYPNSQLGSIQQMAEMVATGVIQLHNNTFGGLSALYKDLEVLDTPYLTKSVDDALLLFDTEKSPIMKELNDKFVKTSGVRILFTFFGGTRQLTCTKPIYSPADLKGVKIRAIPSKVFVTAVEGMGAIPIAIDWADTPAALATGVASGQENAPNTVFSARLYETQKFMMDTRHIISVGPVVMNDAAFRKLTTDQQRAITEAAKVTSQRWNTTVRNEEEGYIAKLKEQGVTFITQAQGLKYDEFKAGVDALVAKNFAQYADYYKRINAFLGYK